jgi:hypothetical protein
MLTVVRMLKYKKITDIPHYIYNSNSLRHGDMSLSFDEVFQCVMIRAAYDNFNNGVKGRELNLKQKSY